MHMFETSRLASTSILSEQAIEREGAIVACVNEHRLKCVLNSRPTPTRDHILLSRHLHQSFCYHAS